MGRAHTAHHSGFVGNEPRTQPDGSPLPFSWNMARKKAAPAGKAAAKAKATIKIKVPSPGGQESSADTKPPKSTLGRGIQVKRKSPPQDKEQDSGGSNSAGGAGSAGKRARTPLDAGGPAPVFVMDFDARPKEGGGEVYTTAPQSPEMPEVAVVPDPPAKEVPDLPEQAEVPEPEPEPQKQVQFKIPRNISPTMTLAVVMPGTDIGISARIEFVVPVGCNLGDQRSWKTFLPNNAAILNRLNASQLCQLAVAQEFTQPAPILAGVSAALIKLSGKRMKIEMEVAHEQKAAAAVSAAVAAKTTAPTQGQGDDRAALMANLGLLAKLDVDKSAWETLGDRFFDIEDRMSVSTANRPAEVVNSYLLQALGTVLQGSAAKVRTDYMRTAGEAASYEELRDLIITEYRPNDAYRLMFQSLNNMGKVVAGHVNSKTLVAAFNAKYLELHPLGVDTQGKYDHVAMQFTASVLNCFPELMRKLRGKEPKTFKELVKWFHLQFQGGVIPRAHAAIWAVSCSICSGHHPAGKCRLKQKDGAAADAGTAQAAGRRRDDYRKPRSDRGGYSQKQVLALEQRCEQACQRQEDPEMFGASIAALAGQYDRQGDDRDARQGGGRWPGRGRGKDGRGRGGRGGGRGDWNFSRNGNDNNPSLKNQVAAMVKKSLAAMRVAPIDMEDSE